MESLVPDFSKITKAERVKQWFLCMCGHLALKPFQTQTHMF
jgi:CDGSH-type Zn-finger protein